MHRVIFCTDKRSRTDDNVWLLNFENVVGNMDELCFLCKRTKSHHERISRRVAGTQSQQANGPAGTSLSVQERLDLGPGLTVQSTCLCKKDLVVCQDFV
jgi:hypothetical protein